MIHRDFLLRQIQQFVQVLAEVLARKKGHQHELAVETLTEGIRELLGLELAEVLQLDRDALLDLCTYASMSGDDWFSGDKAVALADLLHEEGSAAADERAAWLYEAALTSDAAVPFDIHERIAALRPPPGNP
ncbi:MAG: hypothetical protein AAF170_07420 [Bacteroidota bacterium]